jgi:hypothetical protein
MQFLGEPPREKLRKRSSETVEEGRSEGLMRRLMKLSFES